MSLQDAPLPRHDAPRPSPPGWVNAADVLIVLLGVAAFQAAVFGGFEISVRNPWRPLSMAVVLFGLRHYLVRTPPMHERLWRWALRVRRLDIPGLSWIDAARKAAAHRATGFHEQRGWLQAIHVLGLWSVAVAQPLFDVLGRSPEFFVAHDTEPGNLIGLVLVLAMAGPAACLVGMRLFQRLGPRWHVLAAGGVIGMLVAAVALGAVGGTTGWDPGLSFGAAAVAGALGAGAYVLSSAARLFATFLSPAAVVIPAVFLLQPTVAPFLSTPPVEADPLDGVTFGATPPVVVVVFDQLPLASLLDRDGEFDRTVYPNFASLADDATWFSNASAVATLTNFALPPIVTGNYPSPDRRPMADDHPLNLFTALGSRYRLHVHEPLTDLCPETLCERDRPEAGAWLFSMLSDLTIVYLWAVLPETVATARLPPVTQSWRDFGAGDMTFGNRWIARRTQDRREAVAGFIAEIAADTGDSRPALHFLHVLLPHEPWVYLPTGQRYSHEPRILGGTGNGRWGTDARAVALNYQRHLLQTQYVDGVLGRLLGRLRDEGLYDDAVVVVTADHGMSLRPGLPSRTPSPTTFADIASVPLLIKRPGQRDGRVATTNVETIDILPTIAGELEIGLPWEMDGSNAFMEDDTPRSVKTMFIHRATSIVEGSADLRRDIAEGVDRKFAIFPSGDARDHPRLGVHDDLVGVRVTDLPTAGPAGFEVVIDSPALLSDVDHDSDFVPAHITGSILPAEREPGVPALAVAINDVVAAVTRAYPFRAFGRDLAWEAIVDPRLFAQGGNTAEVFAIRDGADGAAVLEPVRSANAAGASSNLLSAEAEALLGVMSSGFFSREWLRDRPFRWTTDTARLSVPMDPAEPPSTLTVDVLMTGPPKQLRITVDGCRLLDETIQGSWTRTWALDACRIDGPTAEIELVSDVHVPATGDNRALGVAVASIELRSRME